MSEDPRFRILWPPPVHAEQEYVGLAELPALTESELIVLLTAVEQRRLRLMVDTPTGNDEVRVLWSLSTAVSEAIFAARLNARWQALADDTLEIMTKPEEHPPQSNKPDSPPGHEADPGRGQEDAPGQNKPKPDQELPEDQPLPDQSLPEDQPIPGQELPEG